MLILWVAVCGFALDLLLGDPAWMPHPVVWMGRLIERAERFLRPPAAQNTHRRILGRRIAGGPVAVGNAADLWRRLSAGALHPPLAGLCRSNPLVPYAAPGEDSGAMPGYRYPAMAGVRLGYALCADIAYLGQPCGVSILAQSAGIAALEDYAERVRALVPAERPWLSGQLRRLGLRLVPGEAKYLLFSGSEELLAPLAERGMRSCNNFAGLDDTWYRTSIRTHAENRRLVQALKEVIV